MKKLFNLVLMNVAVIFVFSFCVATFQKANYQLDNDLNSKNASSFVQVDEYKTIEIFDKSIPSNITKVVVEGQDGLSFIDKNGNKSVIKEVVDEQKVIGTGKYGIYHGNMTGYGPDCDSCDGRGYVACDTRDHKSFNILRDGVYYTDTEYGKARVLAAAFAEFPCGTVIEVDSPNLGKFLGIVMDTGSMMRRYWNKGIALFDVAYMTEDDPMVPYTTCMKGKVTYSVQRWGW